MIPLLASDLVTWHHATAIADRRTKGFAPPDRSVIECRKNLRDDTDREGFLDRLGGIVEIGDADERLTYGLIRRAEGMARKSRIDTPRASHHIIIRAIERRATFKRAGV